MNLNKNLENILKRFESQEVKRNFLYFLFQPKKPVQLDLFKKHPIELIDEMLSAWIKAEGIVKQMWLSNPSFRLAEILVLTSVIPYVEFNKVQFEEEYFLKMRELNKK